MELKIIQYNNAINNLTRSLVYLDECDCLVVNDIISKYESKIDEYNKNTLSIVNPTRREIGNFTSSLKKRISSIYINKVTSKYWQDAQDSKYDCCDVCDELEYIKWCESCKEKDEIKDYKYSLFYEINTMLNEVVNSTCNNTILTDKVRDAHILLSRRCRYYNRNPLEVELSSTILLSMQEEFEQQNPKFRDIINKKIEEYETSKQ